MVVRAVTVPFSPGPFSEEVLDARGTFELLVRAVRLEADGIVSLELARPDGGELPGWEPGAHVELVLPSGRVRHYSLCGDPAQRLAYRIAELREPGGRGGSAEIYDTELVGHVLSGRPPRNHFELVEAAGYLFVAGGITPLLPMIHSATARGRPWHLYYGGRSLRSTAFAGEALAAAASNVTLWPQGKRGLLDLPAILAIGVEGTGVEGTAIYCCGPEGLLGAMEAASAAAGVAGRLHTERFTQDAAAAVAASAAHDDDLCRPLLHAHARA